jgi:hypothetical protein
LGVKDQKSFLEKIASKLNSRREDSQLREKQRCIIGKRKAVQKNPLLR